MGWMPAVYVCVCVCEEGRHNEPILFIIEIKENIFLFIFFIAHQ